MNNIGLQKKKKKKKKKKKLCGTDFGVEARLQNYQRIPVQNEAS